MNIVLWLAVGGLFGWIASKIANGDAQQGVLPNVIVGIVGAVVGGFAVTPLSLGPLDFSATGLAVSLVGAAILLANLNLVTRGRTR